jgi:putative ABC transport system permease protein
MIRFNLILAFRNLLKNRVYSFLVMGGFSIGFAAFILIGLFYHSEKTVNKGFENHKQIYRLYDAKNVRANIHYDLTSILAKNFAEVEDVCPLDYSTGIAMTAKNEQKHTDSQVEHLLATTNNFFSIFSLDVAEKLSDKPFDRKDAMALSKSTALMLFGNENPLGQQVNISNFIFGTVTAIINDLPANSTFKADIILNSDNEAFRMNNTHSGGLVYNPTNIFVKLKQASDPNGFLTSLNSTIDSHALDIDSVGMQNLGDIYLSTLPVKSRHAKGNPAMLRIFIIIALVILILSSINYLNYSISMQFAKMKEIGINKINGATWKNLIQYTFTEVSIGVLFSLIFAVIISAIAFPYSKIIFGKEVFFGAHDLILVAPLILGVAVAVILINSLAPIYVLSRFNISGFLSGFRGNKNRKQIGRQAMLTFQLTVSIALIAVVMVIFKQLHFMKHSDLGFDSEKLMRIDIPFKFSNTETLKQETEKLPFVKSSTISSGCPGMINHKYGTGNNENSFSINCINVGNDYLKTMGIELVEGRDFLAGDIERACLMNEEAINQYQWDEFQGKKLDIGGEDGGYNVVGVVKNFKFESLHYLVEPLALIYTKTPDGNVFSVSLEAGNIGHQLDQIQQIWKKLSPNEPFIFSFYDDQFQALYEKEERLARSVTFFCLIAIVLTCMGILGHIFLICLNKVKEIGIRKVNGARTNEVMAMLNRDFIKWVGFAFLIACPIAWYAMHKWLENFAYKTEMSWWVFAAAGGIAMIIALTTVSWQSWRAATRNPVESLRYG